MPHGHLADMPTGKFNSLTGQVANNVIIILMTIIINRFVWRHEVIVVNSFTNMVNQLTNYVDFHT